MTDEIVNWDEGWKTGMPDGETYKHVSEVVNVTLVISEIKFGKANSKQNGEEYEYVIITTDKGKIRTSSKPIREGARAHIMPVVNKGAKVKVVIKSKPSAHGTYYYFAPAE
jgi:hypothetical protein